LFAMLPTGQDPDDVLRTSGPGAMAEVLAATCPLADLLWSREVETSRFDTPERRARLEARINEITGLIADETVRRYYRDELRSRLRSLTRQSADPARAASPQRSANQRLGSAQYRGGRKAPSPDLCRPSTVLAASSMVRRLTSSMPPREALILLAALNHPWLLETEAERLAGLDFVNRDADMLRRAMLTVTGEIGTMTASTIRQALHALNCAAVLGRVEGAVTHLADWPAREGAAAADVQQWWDHVLALHRKGRTLNRELKEAEQALGEETSEENFARLLELHRQLSALDGSEATIEGFGALSGRGGRGL
jgi:DNA primase